MLAKINKLAKVNYNGLWFSGISEHYNVSEYNCEVYRLHTFVVDSEICNESKFLVSELSATKSGKHKIKSQVNITPTLRSIFKENDHFKYVKEIRICMFESYYTDNMYMSKDFPSYTLSEENFKDCMNIGQAPWVINMWLCSEIELPAKVVVIVKSVNLVMVTKNALYIRP